MTFYEIETQRRNLAASRVQGLSRMRQARDRARSRILSQFEKRFDVYSGKFYYHSNKTKIDTFMKPRLLRPDQVRFPSTSSEIANAIKHDLKVIPPITRVRLKRKKHYSTPTRVVDCISNVLDRIVVYMATSVCARKLWAVPCSVCGGNQTTTPL